jgi:Leucine-rich repeat (LRR) protein
MDGPVPDSIGELILLEEFWLEWNSDSNMFVGPLPSSMSDLVLLTSLWLNVATLSGPLPDLSKLTRLNECVFVPSDLCHIPEFVPTSSCDFTVLPICEISEVADCVVLAVWLPQLFDSSTCCQVDGVTCEDGRLVILDISSAKTGIKIDGEIPISVGGWEKLQEIYLQGNRIEGNIPLSLARLESLQIVDISNNKMSGIITSIPLFTLIGLDSNSGLSLPDASIETPKTTPDNISSGTNSNLILIIGISLGFLAIVILFVVLIVLNLKEESISVLHVSINLMGILESRLSYFEGCDSRIHRLHRLRRLPMNLFLVIPSLVVQ